MNKNSKEWVVSVEVADKELLKIFSILAIRKLEKKKVKIKGFITLEIKQWTPTILWVFALGKKQKTKNR